MINWFNYSIEPIQREKNKKKDKRKEKIQGYCQFSINKKMETI